MLQVHVTIQHEMEFNNVRKTMFETGALTEKQVYLKKGGKMTLLQLYTGYLSASEVYFCS